MSAYSTLARCVSRTFKDTVVAAGPSAENFIIGSHRRLLVYLRASDGDQASREMEDYLAKLAQMSGLIAFAGIGSASAGLVPAELPDERGFKGDAQLSRIGGVTAQRARRGNDVTSTGPSGGWRE